MDGRAFYRVYSLEHTEGMAPARRVRRSGSFVPERVRISARLFAKYLDQPRNSLLDVGCGEGAPALFIQNLAGFEHVWGIDIDAQALEAAKALGVSAVACNLDAPGLPFPDTSFDGVFAGEVMEHLLDTDHALSEFYRVLRPNGVLVVTTPNLASWIDRIALLLGWQPFETWSSFRCDVGRPGFLKMPPCGETGAQHIHVYPARALREHLEAFGFRVVAFAQAHMREPEREPPNRWRWYNLPVFLLDKLFVRIPSFGHRLIVAARKTTAP
jgi:SAM-dependent methyltransferase